MAQALTVALGPDVPTETRVAAGEMAMLVQQASLAKTIFSIALQKEPRHPRALLGSAMASLLARDWEPPASCCGMRAISRPRSNARRSRPRSTTFAPSRAFNNLLMRIGIDLGGTKIEGIALADDGRELDRRRIAAPRGRL